MTVSVMQELRSLKPEVPIAPDWQDAAAYFAWERPGTLCVTQLHGWLRAATLDRRILGWYADSSETGSSQCS
jgi:hypothetical protein